MIYSPLMYILYCSAIKKTEILVFATTWMNLESIILSQISQTEEDKYHLATLTCGLQKGCTQKQRVKWWFQELTDGGNAETLVKSTNFIIR